MTIVLDLTTDLPKVRAAFDVGELQAQKELTNPERAYPSYTGPCAIGCMLTPEQRAEIETDESDMMISHLYHTGVIAAPVEQMPDFIELQFSHDAILNAKNLAFKVTLMSDFADMLQHLEAKYATA